MALRFWYQALTILTVIMPPCHFPTQWSNGIRVRICMMVPNLVPMLCGGKSSEGVFVGAFLSMSSTAVVLKFLMEKNSTNALHGQVTIGTLILQDCAVGLLFALLPVLGGTSGVLQGLMSMTKVLVVLIAFLAVLSILSCTWVPWFLKLMMSLSSQTNELYQLASVAFCLLVAWSSDKLGLSLELGSFAAGVMISTTDLAQHTLEQIEPIRNFFAALFLASIGMLIHVHFLWSHVDILLASVILVIIIKTAIITAVVKGFGYNNKTSLLVGMSLAQIGEFAFVLLSRASNLHLVEGKLYLLLLGTTALSLVTTTLLFKLIPAVMHLGVLLRWFPPDSAVEVSIELDLKEKSSDQTVVNNGLVCWSKYLITHELHTYIFSSNNVGKTQLNVTAFYSHCWTDLFPVHKISDLLRVLLLALLSCSSQACNLEGISRLLIEGTKSWNIRDWREELEIG
ncbi:hypothetical protein NC653_039464 [Populus alba x Populus x berolinensis]|nr:hypothetical protein NC653_039464 [Populus alba x Populus x berolinensis]